MNPPESSEIDQPATDELVIEDSEPSGEDTLSIVEEPAPTGQEKDKDENNDTLLEEKLEEEVFDDLEEQFDFVEHVSDVFKFSKINFELEKSLTSLQLSLLSIKTSLNISLFKLVDKLFEISSNIFIFFL